MGLVARTLAPARIVALGLTFSDHLRETGEKAAPDGPARFERDPASLVRDGRVRRPTHAQLIAALERLEPGLGAKVAARHDPLPALLDYEVELGIQLLEDGRLGWLLVNDVTARTVQILGEGARERMRFWSASKSFPATLVMGDKMLVSDETPDLELILRVRGEVRQRARSTALLYPAAELVRFARTVAPLQPGDLIMTGTPAGVALTVRRWQRALVAPLLGRFGRLEMALRRARKGRRYLEPGDELEMEAGPLGSVRATVVAGEAAAAAAC
jgi:2-keto-4-pentenoate hydratase/2-oxohepta-3-ene-1,7-dioic acid hydratase in catechol pathway